MNATTAPSKTTRQHEARATRRAAVRIDAIEEEMCAIADANMPSISPGSNAARWLQELAAERDAIDAAHPGALTVALRRRRAVIAARIAARNAYRKGA